MTIPEENQHKVAFFLGYPAKILQPDSTDYNKIFANRMTNLPQYTVARVDQLLTIIEETRTHLDDTRRDANVTRVGEISIDANLSDRYIYKQYNRYVGELSKTLDIPRNNSPGMVRW